MRSLTLEKHQRYSKKYPEPQYTCSNNNLSKHCSFYCSNFLCTVWLTVSSFLALAIQSRHKYFRPLIQESGGLRCAVEGVSELRLPLIQPRSQLILILRPLRSVFGAKLRSLSLRCTVILTMAPEMYIETLLPTYDVAVP